MTNVLKAEIRGEGGTSSARSLRNEGRVPAIVYGNKKDELKISLDRKELVLAYNKGSFKSRVFEIDAGKEKFKAIPRDVQLHPVTETPLHADFMFVSDDSKIRVMVKVSFHNHEKSPGLKRGGVLNIVRHEIELLCPVDSIPTELDADLSGLMIGDSIHISAIKLPDDVEPTITDRDFTVATIAGRTAKEEETVVAAEGEEGEEGDEEGDEEAAEGSEESSDGGE